MSSTTGLQTQAHSPPVVSTGAAEVCEPRTNTDTDTVWTIKPAPDERAFCEARTGFLPWPGARAASTTSEGQDPFFLLGLKY